MSANKERSTELEPVAVDEWLLRYGRFDAAHEGLREALCTLGNGYFATRGAAPEAVADGIHYPGTYVAGLYDRRTTHLAGRAVENESIVNLPNWLLFTFRIDGGPWFDVGQADILDYSQELDLRRATLSRSLRVRDAIGRITRVVQRRFVSMADPHIAGLETEVTADNWSGRLSVRSGIDGRIINAGVPRYAQFDERHLVDVSTAEFDDETVTLTARTSQSGVLMAEASRTRVYRAGEPVEFRSPNVSRARDRHPRALPRDRGGPARHRRKGGGPLHLEGPVDDRSADRGVRPDPTRRTLHGSARRPHPRVGQPVEAVLAGGRGRRRHDPPGAPPPHLPSAPDRLPKHPRPRCRCSRPRPAR